MSCFDLSFVDDVALECINKNRKAVDNVTIKKYIQISIHIILP